MIRYHNITKCDMLNGSGLRVVLWLSHCEHFCPFCHNPETHSEFGGIPFDKSAKEEIFEELEKDYIAGITFSGGDCLSTINRQFTLELAKEIKEKFPQKNIWAYTGYLWEQVKDLKGIEFIDVLVDGKFVKDLSMPSPRWCGSSNQKILNVKESLKQNKPIEYKDI